MSAEAPNLHILFFPGLFPGHMLPMTQMAKAFAARGVRVTILTTPANSPAIQPAIAGTHIGLRTIPFPSAASGLPEGCENLYSLPPSLHFQFITAIPLLRGPFDEALREIRPDCIVSDSFMPWTFASARELGIPRIAFCGTCFFSTCVFDHMVQQWPLQSLPPGTQSFFLPEIPHRIEMLVSQIPEFHLAGTPSSELFRLMSDVDGESYGMLTNSFYELETEYVEHYRKVIGRRSWHVGPLSLLRESPAATSPSGGRDPCLKWLDRKPPCSVVYICFGSISSFTKAQLQEIALGLEAAGHLFLWVVNLVGTDGSGELLPEGFEERVKDRGLVIRRWAPQIEILSHRSVGGFLTHCGWNSSVEAICAGIPVATWPLFAEQFYNERLLVEVLKIAVSVGLKKCTPNSEERTLVDASTVEVAVRKLMEEGEEAAGRRRRVGELREKAQRAVEEGGSSYEDLGRVIGELVEMKQAMGIEGKTMKAVNGEEKEAERIEENRKYEG
ncbi:UDP-glucose flavonoid 3-O-glucosyltransferase 7 [Apostasia shenzhenica]|uniref:Glycosyltransferase n=1 Tax=Apostasia shenzhenica TaxID=1088818 RepID=A0A2I0A1A2_9ASPA|nr:UDP-glucose flavonoid 3-O-glucosyltransferase 7 [Apostasia shenzhenica]